MQTFGGATALMYACQQCKEHEVLNILLQNPYAVKERDRTLKTPLHYCAENTNIKCAESILKIAPELVNAQDENGYCPLHLAVIAGNKNLMKLLITKGADLNIYDNEGHSPVHWAIVSSEKEALEMTINAGANPSTPDIHGGFPLHYAVQMCGTNSDGLKNSGNAIKVVQTLLHYGVDVNVMDKDCRQPILWAASAGSAEAIIHLISGGARVDASDKDGLTALHCAASRGHTDTIETLITLCGGEVDIIDGNGCSPLFYAVTLGHADSTEVLLKLGAQPNRQDRKGRTAAHCGAAKGQLETLKILQKHDANLWIRNVKGDLPFHEAVASGRKDLVLWFLLQNPNAINIGNNDGRCPLHIAAMYNNTEMIKILLDSKCLINPIMRTSKGVLMTPLNVALCKGHRSCGKFLQLHGGVPFSKVSKLDASFIQAVRISPSQDSQNKVSENQGSKISSKVSPSFKILPPQNDFKEEKKDSGEKKKILRRRKKKRSYPSEKKINNDNSDSEDSFQDVKNNIKLKKSDTNNLKKNGDAVFKNEERTENVKENFQTKNLTTFIASTNGNNFSEENNIENTIHLKSEELEETTSEKSAVSKNRSKLSKDGESIKRLKNVSNLSPNDFPPTMQSVTQLDSEIIEAEIDSGKNENKKIEVESNLQIMEITNLKESRESLYSDMIEGSSEGGNSVFTSPNSPFGNNFENQVKIKNNNESDNEINRSAHNNSVTENLNENDLEIQNKNFQVPILSKQSITKSKERDEICTEVVSEQNYKIQNHEKSEINEKKNCKAKVDVKDIKSNKILEKKNSNNEKSVIKNNKKKILYNEEEVNEKSDCLEPLQPFLDENVVISTSENKASTKNSDSDTLKTLEATKKNLKNEEIPVETIETLTDASDAQKIIKASEFKSDSEKNLKEIVINEVDSDFILKNKKPNTEINDNAASSSEVVDNVAISLKENEIPFIVEVENKILAEEEVADKKALLNFPTTDEIKINDNKYETESLKKKFENETVIQDKENFPNSLEEKKNEIVSQNEIAENAEVPEHENSLDDSDIFLKNDRTNNVKDEGNCVYEKNVSASLTMSNKCTLSDIHIAENFNYASDNNLADVSQANEKPEKSKNDVNKSNSDEHSSNEYENISDEEKKGKENEKSELKSSRVTRLCRRNRDLRDTSQISVTQLVQGTIRKYHMERGIFHQLLELKRLQIRAGRANEQILVKRLVDEYERSRFYPGMKHFTGLYKFREFEKFLYDQLKAINKSHAILPDMKSYDDIDALSDILKKSRFKILSEIPQKQPKCACITQRCHHTMYAYTTIPCSAYVANFRRNKMCKQKRESLLPKINQSQFLEKEKFENRHPTLEFIQGNEKKVISLPQSFPDKGKKYYITFTIKSAQAFKDDEFLEETKHFFKHRHANSV